METVDELGCLKKLAINLLEIPAEIPIILVTGRDSFSRSGARQKMSKVMRRQHVFHINDFSANPRIEDLIRIRQRLGRIRRSYIVAIGGGSVLDMAKLLKATIASDVNSAQELIVNNSDYDVAENILIAAPSTAGSGSEATHFAVCHMGSQKLSVAARQLQAEQVWLDAELLACLPPYLKACSVLDALAQGIESMWARGATEESRAFAEKALRRGLDNYRSFLNDDFEPTVGQAMLQASNLAGKAINISKTTAAHAWSYGFTKRYDVPHGHAVWLTLPRIYHLHQKVETKKMRAIMQRLDKLLGVNRYSCESFFADFLRDFKVDHFQDFSQRFDRNTLKKIIEGVNPERLKNNPVNFSKADIDYIFFGTVSR